MSSEEESAFKEIKEPKSKMGSSSGDFSEPSDKVFIELSETKSNGASKYLYYYSNAVFSIKSLKQMLKRTFRCYIWQQ